MDNEQNRTQTYMESDKVIAGTQGSVWVKYSDEDARYCFARLINLEAKAKINVTALPVLGKTGKMHKPSGWEGTGTAKMYYCDSTQRQKVLEYKKTGRLATMEIEVYNDDEGSNMSRQATTLKNCIIDEITLAKIDAEAEYLDEDVSFTFDDFDMADTFEYGRKDN